MTSYRCGPKQILSSIDLPTYRRWPGVIRKPTEFLHIACTGSSEVDTSKVPLPQLVESLAIFFFY